VLSAVTVIVTVVDWSELTDLAVVVTSKSKVQVPSTSRLIEPEFGEANVNVHTVSPALWIPPEGFVAIFTATLNAE